MPKRHNLNAIAFVNPAPTAPTPVAAPAAVAALPEVPDWLMRLEAQNNILHDRMLQLMDRLGPVLRPSVEGKAFAEEPAEELVPVAAQLRQNVEFMKSTLELIEFALTHLEV